MTLWVVVVISVAVCFCLNRYLVHLEVMAGKHEDVATEFWKQSKELRDRAWTDPLTGEKGGNPK